MVVKIFTMAHKKFMPPEDSIYIPLHVGRASAQDVGYMGDDTGESISEWNHYFGELTGVYWVWKNIQDADIIGICHYRRYFLDKDRKLMNRMQYEDILQKYDMIVPNLAYADTSYKEYYGEAHNVADLLATGEVLKEKYPEYAPYFAAAMAGNCYYYGNLMVSSRQLFQSYAAWLFDILFEVQKRVDVSGYDLYNQRVFGFLSEQLLKVWIDKNGVKVYEANIGITAEKAETTEFKLAMTQLVKLGEIGQAREMFYEYLKLRPDIRLELSDIKGEIPIIEQLLYIAEQEQQRGISGLSGLTNKLEEWIVHFHRVRQCLVNFSNGQSRQEDVQYILEKDVSWVMAKIILLNTPEQLVTDADKAIQIFRGIYQQAGKEFGK